MSTQINIPVDSGGLSARAKQQQEAARLAQLERERTRRTEAEAKAQREAKQTAEGRRPDGQPQFGAPPPNTRPQDEPAAFRAATFSVGHLWIYRKSLTSQEDLQRSINFDIFSPPTGASGITLIQNQTYDQQFTNDVLAGSGALTKSTQVAISEYNKPIPGANEFTVGCTFYSSVLDADYYTGELKVVTASAYDRGAGYFLMPAGKDRYVLIEQAYATYGQSIGTHNFWYRVFRATGVRDPVEPDRYYGQSQDLGTCPVPSASGYKSHEIKTNYSLVRRAFICSNLSIREIPLPSVMRAVLETLYPEPTIQAGSFGTHVFRGVTYGNDYYINTAGPAGSIPSGFNPSFLLLNSSQINQLKTLALAVYSPDIYDVLSFYYNYGAPVKNRPTNVNYKLADLSKGGYGIYSSGTFSPPYITSSALTIYTNGIPIFYTQWPIKDQDPDLRTYDSYWESLNLPFPKPGKQKLSFSENRPSIAPAVGEGFAGACVWDWDDPAYCRQHLTALGFTVADLTP